MDYKPKIVKSYKSNPFNTMPREIILYILEYCIENNVNIFSVCKSFNSLVDILWRKKYPEWIFDPMFRPLCLIKNDPIIIPKQEYNVLQKIITQLLFSITHVSSIGINLSNDNIMQFIGSGSSHICLFQISYNLQFPCLWKQKYYSFQKPFPNLNTGSSIAIFAKDGYLKFIEKGIQIGELCLYDDYCGWVPGKEGTDQIVITLLADKIIPLENYLKKAFPFKTIFQFSKTGLSITSEIEDKFSLGILDNQYYTSEYSGSYINPFLQIAKIMKAEAINFCFSEKDHSRLIITIKREPFNVDIVLYE